MRSDIVLVPQDCSLEKATLVVASGGTVKVSAGEYRLSRKLVIKKSFRLIGDGCGKTIISGNFDGGLIEITSIETLEIEQISFKLIPIHFGSTGSILKVEASLAKIEKCNFIIENFSLRTILPTILVSQFLSGIYITGETAGFIRDCDFYGCKESILIDECSTFSFDEKHPVEEIKKEDIDAAFKGQKTLNTNDILLSNHNYHRDEKTDKYNNNIKLNDPWWDDVYVHPDYEEGKEYPDPYGDYDSQGKPVRADLSGEAYMHSRDEMISEIRTNLFKRLFKSDRAFKIKDKAGLTDGYYLWEGEIIETESGGRHEIVSYLNALGLVLIEDSGGDKYYYPTVEFTGTTLKLNIKYYPPGPDGNRGKVCFFYR